MELKDESLISKRLLTKDFYLDNMSMFMKDSYGIIDREEVYRAVLNNIYQFALGLFSRLDVRGVAFTEDYFVRNCPASMTPDEYEQAYDDEVLDMIGAIYGISRIMNVEYYGDASYPVNYGNDPDKLYKWTLKLNNKEMLIYILVMITKLNYQGTTGEIADLYYGDGTPVKDLDIYYNWNNPLECDVSFNNSFYITDPDADDIFQYNSNLVKLFLADKLLIESLGVQYHKLLTMAKKLLTFDLSGIPDIDPDSNPPVYKYIFDPDFDHQFDSGFEYYVFN